MAITYSPEAIQTTVAAIAKGYWQGGRWELIPRFVHQKAFHRMVVILGFSEVALPIALNNVHVEMGSEISPQEWVLLMQMFCLNTRSLFDLAIAEFNQWDLYPEAHIIVAKIRELLPEA